MDLHNIQYTWNFDLLQFHEMIRSYKGIIMSIKHWKKKLQKLK
jgi:hypothetical protein